MSKVSPLQLELLGQVFPKLTGRSPLLFNLERGKVRTFVPEEISGCTKESAERKLVPNEAVRTKH